MKRTIGVTLIMASLLAVFCVFGSSLRIEASDGAPITSFRDLSILAVTDRDAYLDAYLPLSAEDKAFVWQDKIMDMIDGAAGEREWTDEQLEVLIELYELLTPELFERAVEGAESVPELNDWAARASDLFAEDDFDVIVKDLRDFSAERLYLIEAEPSRYCNCHSTGIISCRLGQGCTGGNCQRTSSGCGLLGLFPCRGICVTPGGPIDSFEPAPSEPEHLDAGTLPSSGAAMPASGG